MLKNQTKYFRFKQLGIKKKNGSCRPPNHHSGSPECPQCLIRAPPALIYREEQKTVMSPAQRGARGPIMGCCFSPPPEWQERCWSLVIFPCTCCEMRAWRLRRINISLNVVAFQCILELWYTLVSWRQLKAQKKKKPCYFFLLKPSPLIQPLHTYFFYSWFHWTQDTTNCHVLNFKTCFVLFWVFFAHFNSHMFAERPRSRF